MTNNDQAWKQYWERKKNSGSFQVVLGRFCAVLCFIHVQSAFTLKHLFDIPQWVQCKEDVTSCSAAQLYPFPLINEEKQFNHWNF